MAIKYEKSFVPRVSRRRTFRKPTEKRINSATEMTSPPIFVVFTHVTSVLTTVAIRHVGAQTNALNKRSHSKKASLKMVYVVFGCGREVTGIKGLDFIEYLQWQRTKDNLQAFAAIDSRFNVRFNFKCGVGLILLKLSLQV